MDAGRSLEGFRTLRIHPLRWSRGSCFILYFPVAGFVILFFIFSSWATVAFRYLTSSRTYFSVRVSSRLRLSTDSGPLCFLHWARSFNELFLFLLFCNFFCLHCYYLTHHIFPFPRNSSCNWFAFITSSEFRAQQNNSFMVCGLEHSSFSRYLFTNTTCWSLIVWTGAEPPVTFILTSSCAMRDSQAEFVSGVNFIFSKTSLSIWWSCWKKTIADSCLSTFSTTLVAYYWSVFLWRWLQCPLVLSKNLTINFVWKKSLMPTQFISGLTTVENSSIPNSSQSGENSIPSNIVREAQSRPPKLLWWNSRWT